MGKDCIKDFTGGAACFCNLSCLECRRFLMISDVPFEEFRSTYRPKYVCFNCNHIFKNKYTTSINHCSNREVKSEKYLQDDNAHCNICGNMGIEVGQSFRHCKNKKDWKNMKEQYENGDINLIKDFTPCSYDRINERQKKAIYKKNHKFDDKPCCLKNDLRNNMKYSTNFTSEYMSKFGLRYSDKEDRNLMEELFNCRISKWY